MTIREKKKQYHAATELDQKISLISRRLRTTGRQKVKLIEELKWSSGQLQRLMGLLKNKMSPECETTAVKNDAETKEDKTVQKARKRKGTHGK